MFVRCGVILIVRVFFYITYNNNNNNNNAHLRFHNNTLLAAFFACSPASERVRGRSLTWAWRPSLANRQGAGVSPAPSPTQHHRHYARGRR